MKGRGDVYRVKKQKTKGNYIFVVLCTTMYGGIIYVHYKG